MTENPEIVPQPNQEPLQSSAQEQIPASDEVNAADEAG